MDDYSSRSDAAVCSSSYWTHVFQDGGSHSNFSNSQSHLTTALAVYGQRPEGEKNFSERPCCHSRHHRTATVATAFERPVIASAAEEPIRTGSDDRAAFVASTITPFLVELHLTDGDATIVSVGRFAAEIG
ncbi:hypothetical protein Q3G72_014807 [Acer saccharum]|nr:hypothetical protein Q3G72_014807 [Acer saccharum]